MILVDTSAWVEFFRGRDPMASRVDGLIEDDDVAICGPIVTELRRGLRTAGERRRVVPLLTGCHLLGQPPRLWEEAGDLGFYLARRGVTAKTLDLLIAAYALAHDLAVLAVDGDFDAMREAGAPLLVLR